MSRIDELLRLRREGYAIPVTKFKDGTGDLFTVVLPLW